MYSLAIVVPKHLVSKNRASCSVEVLLRTYVDLVAVATQCVDDVPNVLRFQYFGASQLTNLLGRLANGQVTRASLSMLDLARGSQSKSLLGALVCLLFTHLMLRSSIKSDYKQN